MGHPFLIYSYMVLICAQRGRYASPTLEMLIWHASEDSAAPNLAAPSNEGYRLGRSSNDILNVIFTMKHSDSVGVSLCN